LRRSRSYRRTPLTAETHRQGWPHSPAARLPELKEHRSLSGVTEQPALDAEQRLTVRSTDSCECWTELLWRSRAHEGQLDRQRGRRSFEIFDHCSTHFLTKRLPRVGTEMSLYVLAYNLKRVMQIVGIVPLKQTMISA